MTSRRYRPRPLQATVGGLTVLAAIACAAPAEAQAPARFYWKALSGSNAVVVIGQSLGGNANPLDPSHLVNSDAEFDAGVATVGYARTFAIGKRAAFAALLVPMGRIGGELRLDRHDFGATASGFGDPMIEIGLNIVGPPAMRNLPDVLRYEPGFSVDLIADVAFPAGEYDAEAALNLGQNRWYGRLGAPVVWQLGPWVPGQRMTLEVIPSIWWFGPNADFDGATLSTEPIFAVDGHLTRDFTPGLWGSLDATYATGGQASLNDVLEGAPLTNLSVGITLGYQLNEELQLTAGYIATISDSDPEDLRMDGFKVSLVYGWHALIEGIKRLGAE